MSDAPERIWADWSPADEDTPPATMGCCTPRCKGEARWKRVDYVRADLPPTLSAALALPEIAALVEADRWQTKKRAQHWLRRTMTAPEDAEVDALCKKHGYGAVIDAASRLWARGPGGSAASYVGGCIGFTSDDAARATLAAIEAANEATE